MTDSPSGTSVGAVVQALRILRHLAGQATPAGVTAIARATGGNPSTCFNILRTLAAERLVEFDATAKTYRLGLGVVELASGLICGNVADLVRPELERLAAGHNALFALWRVTEGDRIVLVERVAAPSALRPEMRVGLRMPAVSGAVGRCVAAARGLDEAALGRAFAGVRWQRAPSFATWQAEVRRAGRLGYALDRGQIFKGIDAVASVVTDRAGRPRLGLSAIAINGLVPADELAALGGELSAAARRLGAALFGHS